MKAEKNYSLKNTWRIYRKIKYKKQIDKCVKKKNIQSAQRTAMLCC